jgi:hypothetical protein
MLLVQSSLPRPFGPVKKLRAELVFKKKNGNKLGGVEAKWYKARNCYRIWVPARFSEREKIAADSLKRRSKHKNSYLRQSTALRG